MFEEFRSFADYIKLYELHRSEGLLLRHLNSVYKVLAQTVPDSAKNDAIREMELYLATMIRQVDSSLVEEWERMRNPEYQPRGGSTDLRPPGAAEADRDVTRDARAFTAAIRGVVFAFLRAFSDGDLEPALAALPVSTDADAQPWTVERLGTALDAFLETHERLRLDPEARNTRHTYVIPAEDRKSWRIQQMLVDPAEANDWVAEFEADLPRSREAAAPVLRLIRIGPLARRD
jgi:hypothetical protein